MLRIFCFAGSCQRLPKQGDGVFESGLETVSGNAASKQLYLQHSRNIVLSTVQVRRSLPTRLIVTDRPQPGNFLFADNPP